MLAEHTSREELLDTLESLLACVYKSNMSRMRTLAKIIVVLIDKNLRKRELAEAAGISESEVQVAVNMLASLGIVKKIKDESIKNRRGRKYYILQLNKEKLIELADTCISKLEKLEEVLQW